MKEQIYDDQISPLVTRIITICKEHKIALIADFSLDDALHCTTALLSDEYGPSEGQLQALAALRQKPILALAETTTTNPDGSKSISIRRI